MSHANEHEAHAARQLQRVRDVIEECRHHDSTAARTATLRRETAYRALASAGADFDQRADALLQRLDELDVEAPLALAEYEARPDDLRENRDALLKMAAGDVWLALTRADADGDPSLLLALDSAPAVHREAIERLYSTLALDPTMHVGQLRRRARERVASRRVAQHDAVRSELRELVTVANRYGAEMASLYGPQLQGPNGHTGFYQALKEAGDVAFRGYAQELRAEHWRKVAEFNAQ